MFIYESHAVLVLELRDEHTVFWMCVGTIGRRWFGGGCEIPRETTAVTTKAS